MVAEASLAERAAWADRLYDKYGVALEPAHTGEYAAIAEDGQVILDRDDVVVLKKAISKFGKGRFGFFKIGSRTLGKWRRGPMRVTFDRGTSVEVEQ